MYLATTTRSDLAYTVRELARFMSCYGVKHWAAARGVLRYLQGTRSLGLNLGNLDNPLPLFRGFTDSDYAGSDTRRDHDERLPNRVEFETARLRNVIVLRSRVYRSLPRR